MRRPRHGEGNASLKMTGPGSGGARAGPARSAVRTAFHVTHGEARGGELAAGRRPSGLCVLCFFFTLRTEHCLFTDCAELFLRSVYWGQTQMSLCHRGQGCSFLTANTEKLTTGNCSVYLLPSLTFSYCVSILIIWINVSVRLSSLKSNGKE